MHPGRVWPLVLAGALWPAAHPARADLLPDVSITPRTLSSAAGTNPSSTPRSTSSRPAPPPDQIRWPEGTTRVPFEDVEGVSLLEATATGVSGRDTTGAFVLDTGAGFI